MSLTNAVRVSNPRTAVRSITLQASLLACLVACSGPHRSRERSVQDRASAAAHGVASDRLRAIMDDLDLQARTAWPQETSQTAPQTRRQVETEALAQMAPLASELQTAAERIPDAIADIRLSEADRRGFMALVQTLGDQSAALKSRIDAQDFEGARLVLERINGTCISCHDRFRDVSGPMTHTGPQPARALGP